MAKLVGTKCPNCGAAIKVDPGARQATCEYCQASSQIQLDPPERKGQAPPAAGQVRGAAVHVIHLPARAVRSGVGAAVGWLITLVVLGGLGVGGYFIWRTVSDRLPSAGAGDAASAEAWEGKDTFVCGGVNRARIEGVKAKLAAGAAIDAGGNCRLELVDVELSAPVGLKLSGNARIEISRGKIHGSRVGIEAGMNAKVTARESTITAGDVAEGKAKEKGEDAPTAIWARINARVDASGCKVSGDVAVRAEMNAEVILDNASVEGDLVRRMNARIVGASR